MIIKARACAALRHTQLIPYCQALLVEMWWSGVESNGLPSASQADRSVTTDSPVSPRQSEVRLPDRMGECAAAVLPSDLARHRLYVCNLSACGSEELPE
jgi:hypothetical protein